ncbi:MAG: response regulator, partial [Mycobacterium sp.]|nr:response regulator [Mycobacterium sp.]
EGEGSEFAFDMRLAAAPGQVAGQQAGRSLNRPASEIPEDARILVVDDNAVNRAILAEMLDGWGLDNAAADSAMSGLALLEAASASGVPVDLVLLDYQMPGMDGDEMLRRMRANPAMASIPVVILSSVDPDSGPATAANVRPQARMMKPVRKRELFTTMCQVIAEGRTARRQQFRLSA